MHNIRPYTDLKNNFLSHTIIFIPIIILALAFCKKPCGLATTELSCDGQMLHSIMGWFLEELAFFQTDLRTSHMLHPSLEPLFTLCLLGYCRRWLCNMVEGHKGWPTDYCLQIACSECRHKYFFVLHGLYLCQVAFLLFISHYGTSLTKFIDYKHFVLPQFLLCFDIINTEKVSWHPKKRCSRVSQQRQNMNF